MSTGGEPLHEPVLVFDPQAIVRSQQLAFGVGRYLELAGFVILTYDIFLLFPQELANVWLGRRNFLKYLYLVDRYFVWIFHILVTIGMSHLFGFTLAGGLCRFTEIGTLLLFVFSLAVSNLLVLLRVINVWKRSAKLRNCLVLFWASNLIVAFVLIPGFHIEVVLDGLNNPFALQAIGPYCNFVASDRLGVVGGTVAILSDVVMMFVAAWNSLGSSRRKKSSLFMSLKEDSFFYFLTIALLRVCNLLFLVAAPPELLAGSIAFTWTVVTTLMGRFLVDMRSEKPAGQPSATPLTDLELNDYSLSSTKFPAGIHHDPDSRLITHNLGEL